MADAIRISLIAPCGMNCRLCLAFSREKNTCPGCRGEDSLKSKSCALCRIKSCGEMAAKARYCYSCRVFPCARLKRLDKRYRTRYGMSMIQNLVEIRESGIRSFVRKEKERWACQGCGALLCVHRPECRSCGRRWR